MSLTWHIDEAKAQKERLEGYLERFKKRVVEDKINKEGIIKNIDYIISKIDDLNILILALENKNPLGFSTALWNQQNSFSARANKHD